MRAMILAVGLACLVLASAQRGEGPGQNGPMFPGRNWDRYTQTHNGDSFSTAVQCADVGVSYCTNCENPYMLCYDCYGGSVIYPDNRGCKDCDTANCWECIWNADGTTTSCIECYFGYMLNSAGSCDDCGTLCWQCEADAVGAQTCTNCYARSVQSQLDGANCISCGANCDTCSIAVDDTITCTRCFDGYYVNDLGRCESCPSNCLSCSKPDNVKLCSACRGDYQVSTDQTKCLACSTGCTACSGQSTTDSTRAACSSCAEDYYFPTGSDQCDGCMPNCVSCAEANVCLQCTTGYFLADDQGSACSPCEWRCKTCSDTVSCDECDAGYINKDATSVTCDPCPANCMTCSVTGAAAGQCTTCDTGYYKDSSNVCKKCSNFCTTCSSLGCSNCMSGYDLADDLNCYKCPEFCNSDADCSYNTTADTALCTNCAVNYALEAQKTCHMCDVGCDNYCSYANSGVDCTCSSGSPSTASGTYQYRGLCTASMNDYACKAGYYYDDTTTTFATCVGCNIEGCIHCNSTENPIPCVDCDSNGYVVIPNANAACDACIAIHSKCQMCSDATTCTSCDTGYAVTDGTCRACGTLCNACSFSGSPATSTCSDCKVNSVADPDNSANCKACVSPCTSCSVDTDGNTICNSGGCPGRYVFNNDACEPCPENCGTCEYLNSVLTCTDGQCDSYYGNVGTECGLCPNDCTRCSVSTDEGASDALLCDSCDTTFTKNDLLCSPCPSNCESCTEAVGTVLGATPNLYFYLDSNGQCPRCPANCQKCSATSCQTCDDGFGLSADRKTCVACGIHTGVDNCVECDSAAADGTANCFRCASAYVLSDDWKYCNLTSVLGAKCSQPEDHYPECTTCDGDRALDENDLDFEYPKQCHYECYACGVVDFETMTIVSGDMSVCNPEDEETANFTMTHDCYDGVCGVAVLLVDGQASLAVRGCIRNTTCDDTEGDSETETCRTDADGNEVCSKCCNGDKCNTYYYSSGRVVYASIAVILMALANALSLKF